MTYTTNSEAETIENGIKLGTELKGGELIALLGDLGGGKTQFTKGIAKALGVKEEVVSPTFTIERIYEGKKLTLHHFDFYRLGVTDPEIAEEVTELIKDPKNVVVIEWATNLEGLLPKEYLEINFEYQDTEKRKLDIKSVGSKFKYLEEIK